MQVAPIARPACALLKTFWFSFAALLLFACRHAQISMSCPAGAQLMGAPPPKGFEVWCQKNVNGKPVKDGLFIVYSTGGDKMIEGTYRNGVQEGEWTLWYENGLRASIDHYLNGLQNGLHTSWYANGQKALEGEYQDGKREGVWTQWDPSGLSSRRMVYKDGKAER
jgi:MORN repeat variant